MVQEVTTQSWGSRIMSSLWGILIGLFLIGVSFFVVFWNEGHGLRTAQSLEQAQKVLISVPNSPVDPKNDNKVIYFNGLATTNDVLTDSLFGISEKAIKLERKVEMYQWEENSDTQTEKQMGGSEKEVTNYTYAQTWSEKLISSKEFKEQTGHQNPAAMSIQSKNQSTEKVTVGDFHLPGGLITQISGETAVDLSKVDTAALQTKFNKPVKHVGDGLYAGADPQSPQIGDLRVSLFVVFPQNVSVIGQQITNTLQAYLAPAGQTVLLLEMGQVSSQQMIENALTGNQIMTWVIRLVSLFMMIMGFALLLKPLSVLADVIPFLGSLVGFGTGLVAFVCGLVLWAVATAIAWFVVRPLWAIGLIVIAAAISYVLFAAKKRKQAM